VAASCRLAFYFGIQREGAVSRMAGWNALARAVTVPALRQLVITDVEWTVDVLGTGMSLTPGAAVRTALSIGSGTTFNRVFLSRTVEVGSEAGSVAGSEQLTTGVVVASNTEICPSSAEFGGGGLVRVARLLEIVWRGYLIGAH
jgi:hypothetical protein